ncbi:MAG: hypothetical protein IKW81_12970 [Pseudobutyrivibrio sp.]|nr:hypothetical protein [Pseudobutyrivibrio sp.]
MYYGLNKVFDKIDVICQMKADGTVIPLKFRLQNEDGIYETYTVKSYKPLPKKGAHTTPDGLYICNQTDVFECRVHLMGLERTVRLYYNSKTNNTWKLAI